METKSLLLRNPGLGPGSYGLEQIPLFTQALWASEWLLDMQKFSMSSRF